MRLVSLSTCLLRLLPTITVVAAAARPSSSSYKVTPFGSARPLNSYQWNKSPQHPHQSSTISISDIRGGEVESNNVFQIASPYWSSFSKFLQEKTKLVQEKVQPALEDPRTNVWNPIKGFVEAQKQLTKERQEMVKEDPKQAAVLLFNPSRFLKIGVAAWIVAEVLYNFGFFDNPAGVGPKLQKVWKEHAEGPVSQVQSRIQVWWEGERCKGGFFHLSTYRDPSLFWERIRNFAPRYQFAFGACLGMAVSPIVWCLAVKVAKATVVVYLLSELNEYWKDNSSVGESLIEVLGFRGKGGDSFNDFLDLVREAVHSTVLYPDKFWADTKDNMQQDSSDGAPASTKQGFVLGTIVGVIV